MLFPTSTAGNSYRETVASLVPGVKLKGHNCVVWRGQGKECRVGAPVSGEQNSSSTWSARFGGIVLFLALLKNFFIALISIESADERIQYLAATNRLD